jgi:enoyl-CoA hydratase/carnithine racemase
MDVARDVAKRSPTAVRLAKEAVNRSFDIGLESGLDLERKTFAMAYAAADAREGIAAFLEKREPSWPVS